MNPQIIVEVLIPDFQGSVDALKTVMDSAPNILNHNLETVPRLYPAVRPQAVYSRSIELLKRAKAMAPEKFSKSGLMLGLGEEKEEILGVMAELREVSCDFLTLGQYLRPSGKHHPVERYVTPEEFGELRVEGEKMGFKAVFSAPLVRSSFHAAEIFEEIHNPQISQITQRPEKRPES
jgi:lipoic acid synthetase